MTLAFPFHLDPAGHTVRCDTIEAHIRQLLEQLLLTRPGERVNRPEFGCGLGDLVFVPSSPEMAAAVGVTIGTAVTEFLGDLIRVLDLRVTAHDTRLQVDLAYEILADAGTATASISVPVPT
jgi:phage baseplate assembly protein W